MIQRIQTLYMLLALLAIAAMALFPIVSIGNQTIKLFDMGWATLLAGLLTGLIMANIFNYKKRQVQWVIGRIGILLSFALFTVEFFFHFRNTDAMPGYALLAPLLSVVLLSLANRAIKKDEDLVRSADRLR